MTGVLLFNPMEFVEQIIVCVVMVVAAIFIWKYWNRILMAITGDDRIHGTCLDCIYFTFCRCFGLCTCDWTRIVSKHCLCLPSKLRGANLVKRFGQCLGITTSAVELKNIVVGDLPWDRRANFYLCIECEANPPMMSSVAQAQLPKVVHFPEVMTVRLRYSPLEENVRITVRELNLFGSTDVCRASVGAMHILDWAGNDMERMKRIEMTPVNRELAWETQPWILIEFDDPHDDRDLEHFHALGSKVRTATKDGDVQDLSVRAFKEDYTLLDPSGHAMAEPLEDDLSSIACRAWLVQNVHWALTVWGCIGFVVFGVYDGYTRACYKRYNRLTMARLHNMSFPASTAQLYRVTMGCHRQLETEGAAQGTPCYPSDEQVVETCTPSQRGGKMPAKQPPMKAFEGLIQYYTGIHEAGCPCGASFTQSVCSDKVLLDDVDYFAIPGFLIFLCLTCCCRLWGNGWVRGYQQELQRKRAEQTRKFMKSKNEDEGKSSVFTGWSGTPGRQTMPSR